MASNPPPTTGASTPTTPPLVPPKPNNPTTPFFTPTLPALDYFIQHGVDYITDAFPDPISPMDLDTLATRRIHEWYQRTQLNGFTTRQLRLIGCFSPSQSPLPGNLNSFLPCHEFWRDKQWYLGYSRAPGTYMAGDYDMQNPDVKRVMQPVRTLATRILGYVFTTPWFDALAFGVRKNVSPQEAADGCPVGTNRYNAQLFELRDNRIPKVLANYEPYIKPFTEKCKIVFTTNIGNSGAGGAWGSWVRNVEDPNNPTVWQGGTILLEAQMIFPLLDGTLTVAEQHAQQFWVAKVLLHETMHAFGHYIRTTRNAIGMTFSGAEPFFEDESMAENGASWENSFFGGRTEPILSLQPNAKRRQYPVLAISARDYPDWRDFGDGKYDEKVAPTRYRHHDRYDKTKHSLYSTRWPVHHAYLENIQQMNFWDVNVKKFGSDALLFPRILGKATKKGGGRLPNTFATPNDTYMMADSWQAMMHADPTISLSRFAIAAEQGRMNADHDHRVKLSWNVALSNVLPWNSGMVDANTVASLDTNKYPFHEAILRKLKPAMVAKVLSQEPVYVQTCWEACNSLRFSKFLYISAWANLLLGGHPLTAEVECQLYLDRAVKEVEELVRLVPGVKLYTDLLASCRRASFDCRVGRAMRAGTKGGRGGGGGGGGGSGSAGGGASGSAGGGASGSAGGGGSGSAGGGSGSAGGGSGSGGAGGSGPATDSQSQLTWQNPGARFNPATAAKPPSGLSKSMWSTSP